MIKLTADEIFKIRKGLIHAFGVNDSSDNIWFQHLLPAIRLQESIDEWIDNEDIPDYGDRTFSVIYGLREKSKK